MDNIDRIMKEADRLGFGVSYGKYRAAYPNDNGQALSAESVGPEYATFPCKCCGKPFVRSHANLLYCSEECRHQAKRKRDIEYLRRKSGRPLIASCAVCGADFKPKNTRHKCCSEECAVENDRKTQALWRAAHKKGAR